MPSVTVFGIVRTELFCTLTCPGAIALLTSVQFAVMFQSPLAGGEQFSAFAPWLENNIVKDTAIMAEIITFFQKVQYL